MAEKEAQGYAKGLLKTAAKIIKIPRYPPILVKNC